MTFTVELSNRAEADVEQAFQYIAKDSPRDALNWRFSLESAIQTLETFPERCGLAPEHYYAGVEIHQLLHGKYRILFTIRDQTVYVLTLRHGARKFLRRSDINRLT